MSRTGELRRSVFMLTWFIRKELAKFERDFGYDVTYMREVLDADPSAFLLFARVQKLSHYCKDAPPAAWFAAKLAGAMAEDCGPCTQLVVLMAERAGIAASEISAIVRGDEAAMSGDARLGYRFAKTALAHGDMEPIHHEVKRWGKRAAVSLAFAVVAARMYPTLKYALGFGKTCQRVTVGGEIVPVAA
ncbi:MAG TPA: hypothetical protein VGC41_12750 [Kofleriaceae bacterium]